MQCANSNLPILTGNSRPALLKTEKGLSKNLAYFADLKLKFFMGDQILSLLST